MQGRGECLYLKKKGAIAAGPRSERALNHKPIKQRCKKTFAARGGSCRLSAAGRPEGFAALGATARRRQGNDSGLEARAPSLARARARAPCACCGKLAPTPGLRTAQCAGAEGRASLSAHGPKGMVIRYGSFLDPAVLLYSLPVSMTGPPPVVV